MINATALSSISQVFVPKTQGPSLEETVGIDMLSDYDAQLSELSQSIRDSLKEKNQLREEINWVQGLKEDHAVEVENETYLKLTASELAQMKELFPDIKTHASDPDILISEDQIDLVTESLRGELTEKNSHGEILALNVQALTQQRSAALSLVSQLLAQKSQSTMEILRNMRS